MPAISSNGEASSDGHSSLNIDPRGHPSLNIDSRGHPSLDIDPRGHSSLEIDPRGHYSLNIDPRGHPSLDIAPRGHPSLDIDPRGHPSLTRCRMMLLPASQNDGEPISTQHWFNGWCSLARGISKSGLILDFNYFSRISSHFYLANTKHQSNDGPMLGQRRRRWLNIGPSLDRCNVFAG